MARAQAEPWTGGEDIPRRVITYEQAVAHARRAFIRDGGLDMKKLADEIPVGRATLYRVVGGRDRLLGDVFWLLAERTLERAVVETTSEGVERAVEISGRFKQYTLTFGPLRQFLHDEPQTALRVLLTPAGCVGERMAQWWVGIFRRMVASGELALPFDVEWFAYVFVRTGESMTYSDLLAGWEPDLDLAAHVQRSLFDAVGTRADRR